MGKQIMKVKRKVIGILVCMLMLTTIPLAAGMTADSEPDDPETTDIGRTIVRGFVFNYRPTGFGHQFFALRVHYIEITGTTRTTGVITFRPCDVGKELLIGFNYMGPVGMFGYMFGATFRGGIDW